MRERIIKGLLALLFVVLLFGFVVSGVRLYAFEIPQEPPLVELDHWDATFDLVYIWYPMEGFMVGYAHAVRDRGATQKEPGLAWVEHRYIHLVTGGESPRTHYIVDKEAIKIKHTLLGPNWTPLIVKTWDTTCGCPFK